MTYIYYAIQGGSNSWYTNAWPFKWKLLSSTFIWCCLNIMLLGLLMKSYSVIIPVIPVKQYFSVMLFIIIYKMVLFYDYLDEMLNCGHSNQRYKVYFHVSLFVWLLLGVKRSKTSVFFFLWWSVAAKIHLWGHACNMFCNCDVKLVTKLLRSTDHYDSTVTKKKSGRWVTRSQTFTKYILLIFQSKDITT